MRRDQKAYLKAYRARPEYREQSKPYTERAKQKLKSNPVALERLVKYRQEYYLKNREVILKRTRQRQVDKAEQEKLRSKKYQKIPPCQKQKMINQPKTSPPRVEKTI